MVNSSKYKTIGEHLRLMRESVGLSLKAVASKIQNDISLLTKIERNQRQPTKKMIKSIAKFFKVDEKQLLNGFLSDQIAYKILDEEADLNILKVVEQRIKYGIAKHK